VAGVDDWKRDSCSEQLACQADGPPSCQLGPHGMKLFQLRLQEAFAIDSVGRVKSDAILFSFGDGTHRYFFREHSLKYLSQNRYNDII